MSDRPLTERLRAAAHYGRGSTSELLDEAADEIERLTPLATCDYRFDCGCRCLLDLGHPWGHER